MSTLKVNANKPEAALQLKITLLELSPEVWRRVVVPAYFTLRGLHWVIQEVMPWTNSHLHQFKKGDNIYSDIELDFFNEGKQLDEDEITLTEVFPRLKSKIEYEYDFGDTWRHEITLEKKLALDFPQTLQCLGGQSACPPDDSGGPWGYADMLQIVADPKHPEYKDITAWLGKKFEPQLFDLKKANGRLKKRFKIKTVCGWAKEGTNMRL